MEPHRLSLPPLDEPGEVVTFYSHKGGAGRTMALANLAVMLARRHNATVPVLMIDWDMEAPALHHYFRANGDGPGVLELFESCRDQLLRHSRMSGERDDAAVAEAVLDAVGWEQYVSRADGARPLYLMRAGRLDASYAERLARLDWEALFDACPALFRVFARKLADRFRHVLIDARAGRTATAGICTTLLPTKLVLVFTPNRQHLDGLEALVQRATTWRRSHEEEQRQLLIYPLPSRIGMEDGARRMLWRRGDPEQGIPGYQPVFERALAEAYGLGRVSLESWFDEVQLQQAQHLACGEPLPVNGDEDDDRFSVTRSFDTFLGWFLGGHPPWRSRDEIPLLAAVGQGRAAHAAGGRGGALARDLARLGQLYRSEGRKAEAAACLRESLMLHEQAFGNEHADTLAARAALGDLLFEQDNYEEAHFLQEAVLATRERLSGAAAPGTLEAASALAATLAHLGQSPDALALLDTVLDVQQRQLGDEHPATIESLALRADILCLAGQFEPAADLLERVLDLRPRRLGPEHGDTVRTRTALAGARSRQRSPEPAAQHDPREHRFVSVEQARVAYPSRTPWQERDELAEENGLSAPRLGVR